MITRLASEGSFDSLSRQLGDLMQDMTRRTYYRFSRMIGWQPPVNVYEDERCYYLCAELPGLSKDQIHVDVLGSKMTIKGERPAPPPPASEGPGCVLRMEINYGPFERCIELPGNADMNTVSANLNDGFLWITVGKQVA